MIEVTDEMIHAYLGEPETTGTDAHYIRTGLTAVLAIAERDLDPTTVGNAAATAKLYSLAVMDEVRTAAAKFLVDLDDIKRRYVAELSAGPGQFKALIAMADQVERDNEA